MEASASGEKILANNIKILEINNFILDLFFLSMFSLANLQVIFEFRQIDALFDLIEKATHYLFSNSNSSSLFRDFCNLLVV